MAKLVIDNDVIKFSYNNRQYTAEVSRLILEQEVLFNINYTTEDENYGGHCQVSFISSAEGRPAWRGHTAGLTPAFIAAVGIEIEKLPHLMQ